MRDTAIDIGKWINAGYNKGQQALNATTYNNYNDSNFMEQRINRNQRPREQSDPRPISYDNNKNVSVF